MGAFGTNREQHLSMGHYKGLSLSLWFVHCSQPVRSPPQEATSPPSSSFFLGNTGNTGNTNIKLNEINALRCRHSVPQPKTAWGTRGTDWGTPLQTQKKPRLDGRGCGACWPRSDVSNQPTSAQRVECGSIHYRHMIVG